MPRMNTRCRTAGFGRFTLTVLAGTGLAASTFALATDENEIVTLPGAEAADRKPAVADRETRRLTGVDAPRKPVADAVPVKPDVKPDAKKPTSVAKPGTSTPGPERIRIGLDQVKPIPHIGSGKPGLKPQKRVVVPRSLALDLDPVTGAGYIMDHTLTPRLLNLRPASASGGWVGSLMEDPGATVFVIETTYGLCAMVSSSRVGKFRLLPGANADEVVINSQNAGEVAGCGGLVKDLGANIHDPLNKLLGTAANDGDQGILAAALAGGAPPQCWSPGATGNNPDSSSYFVRYQNRSCNSGPFVVDEPGTPDLPDESLRRYGFPCDGQGTIVKPPFDFVVDILYGFSADTLRPEYAGSFNAIAGRAAFEVALMNEVLFNSRMRVKIRLVGVELATTISPSGDLVGFEGTCNPSLDLEILSNIGGTFTQGADNLVLELRDEYGADVVVMMVGCNENPDVGGIAGGGVAVLTWGNGATTFAHEVGHVFGAQHASASSSPEGDRDEDCPQVAFCDPAGGPGGTPTGRVPAPPTSEDAECAWEDYEEWAACYADEVCDPAQLVGDASLDGPILPIIVYPEEYASGFRGSIDQPNEFGGASSFVTVMAYPVDDPPSVEILYFANPEVTFASSAEVPYGGAVANLSCRACISSGNTSANAWIMHERLLNLVANPAWADTGYVPVFEDADGFNHFPSASNVLDPGQATDGLLSGAGYPANYGVLVGLGSVQTADPETSCVPHTDGGTFGRPEQPPLPENNFQGVAEVKPWVRIFESNPGVAQLRCRTIPYDCNQNGLMDTEELDGTAPGSSGFDVLTDVNRDRVPDGCWPRECSDAPSLFNPNQPAVITYLPDVAQDPQNPALLKGSGGIIADSTYTESILAGVPTPGSDEDLYWFFQPEEIRIDNLVHPRLDQLKIELVRRQIGSETVDPDNNPTETRWTVFECTEDSNTRALSGTYIFQVSGGSENAPNPASTALRYQTACGVIASDQYGFVLPSGRYSFSDFEIGAESVPFNSEWLLRVTDTANGSSGFFSGWSMTVKVLPYDEDCNADGIPDTCNEAFRFDSDCDFNNVADSCQIKSDPLLDCDLNGVIDTCEDNTFLTDLGGGVWDADGNGVVSGGPFGGDTFYIQNVLGINTFDPTLPCNVFNPNGRADLCDIIDGQLSSTDDRPDLDENNNLFLDCFESDEVFCATRIFDTSDPNRASGPGGLIRDGNITTFNLVISAEDEGCFGDDEALDPCVTPGSVVLPGFELFIHDLQHAELERLNIRLIHTEPDGGQVTSTVLQIGCPVAGFLRPNSSTYVFSDLGSQTFCEQLATGLEAPDGEDSPYLPDGGGFGAFFTDRPLEGIWRLEFTDPYPGISGTFSSWDLKINFRPPDLDGNSIPDVCEE